MSKSRIEIFEASIRNAPSDSFAHYALAMEYEKAGRDDDAVATYRKLIGFDPNYVPAYQMCGQLFMKLGRTAEAREMLAQGLSIAHHLKNLKAADEMQSLLMELEK